MFETSVKLPRFGVHHCVGLVVTQQGYVFLRRAVPRSDISPRTIVFCFTGLQRVNRSGKVHWLVAAWVDQKIPRIPNGVPNSAWFLEGLNFRGHPSGHSETFRH